MSDVPPYDPDDRTTGSEPALLSAEDRPGSSSDDDRTNPPSLACESKILDVFAYDLRRAGVAGERRLSKLIYLAVTSRLLPWATATNRPVSVLVRGTTSTGKSHAMGTTLRFFPPDAIVDLGSMSKRFLFYDEESYSHRVLAVPEASQVIGDDELLALLRTLLSEGRVVHGTVTADGKPKAFRIEKAGPTGLLMTTTKAYVDDELETRMLSVRSDDTPAQTRRVYSVYADLEEGNDSLDLGRWHELQVWLAAGENRVLVPFVRPLGELMPTGATRLRRDFVSIICLVRSHALLHRASRDIDGDGRIVACLDDYAAVRALVSEIIAEGVEASVSGGVRETVEAVRVVLADGAAFATPRLLQDGLGIGRSATYDRIHAAVKAGYLADESGKEERGMKLVIGAALPGDADSFLPTIADIVRSSSGGHPDDETPDGSRDSEPSSGHPVTPEEPGDDAERARRFDEMFPPGNAA